MNRREAKKEALGLIAADVSANLGTGAWEDQGLLDDYEPADRDRILAAASDILMSFYRRIGS